MPEPADEFAIKDRTLADGPLAVVREVASLQLRSTGDALRIVVERPDAGAEPLRGEAEDPAAGADVEEAFPVEPPDIEHRFQGFLGGFDVLGRELLQERRPIGAEFKPLAAADLSIPVRCHGACLTAVPAQE